MEITFKILFLDLFEVKKIIEKNASFCVSAFAKLLRLQGLCPLTPTWTLPLEPRRGLSPRTPWLLVLLNYFEHWVLKNFCLVVDVFFSSRKNQRARGDS